MSLNSLPAPEQASVTLKVQMLELVTTAHSSLASAGHVSPAVPVHSSFTSHRPLSARHCVPAGSMVSPGHGPSATPVQSSSGSQTSPDPSLHTVLAEAKLSVGHAVSAAPLQTSSGSQMKPDSLGS